jgi:hypothetical protein
MQEVGAVMHRLLSRPLNIPVTASVGRAIRELRPPPHG